ncbi:hypothetical protein E4U21_001663 [Claviceps maximensis]|nr:hypothetical protein E4U21_001663 [Claviceps maximensis]
MDIGSLHGTYVNNSCIAKYQTRQLMSGDILRFGTSVQKGLDTFPACEMRVVLKRGSLDPHERPAVFRVPDSSDEEDSVSDDDEVVDSSMAIMLGAGMASLPADQTTTVGTIDLTGHEAPATQTVDVPVNNVPSDEITSDDKSDSAQSLSDWVPELVDSHPSPHNSSSSLLIDMDREGPSHKGEGGYDESSVFNEADDLEEVNNHDDFPYHPPEYDPSKPELCQSALTYSQPLNCEKRSINLNDADDLYQEKHAEFKNTDSLRAFSPPKSSSQTLKADLKRSTPRPRGAILDATPTHVQQSFNNFNYLGATQNNFLLASRKADFFAAREHNRRIHASQVRIPEETIQGNSSDIAEDHASSMSNSTRSPLSNSSRLFKSSTCTTTAALLAAGEKLLQATSVADVAPANSIGLDDLFDDCSAFAYEMSKRSVGRSACNKCSSEAEEVRMTDDDEAPQLDVIGQSRKRKSDEISNLLPKEVETGSSQTQFASSQPTMNAEASPAMDLDSTLNHCTNPTDCARRPFKRLRQAAEILGYATLGGVAVMSALIVTAPAL